MPEFDFRWAFGAHSERSGAFALPQRIHLSVSRPFTSLGRLSAPCRLLRGMHGSTREAPMRPSKSGQECFRRQHRRLGEDSPIHFVLGLPISKKLRKRSIRTTRHSRDAQGQGRPVAWPKLLFLRSSPSATEVARLMDSTVLAFSIHPLPP